VQCSGLSSAGQAAGRSRHEVADIFRSHGKAYLEAHGLTLAERKVVGAIVSCRTAVLGGHADVCTECGHTELSYNSCRDRHCPKCQSLPQARWIEQRKQRILPTGYFHVVFTLPSELRSLARRNRRVLFDILFAAASAALLDLARDPRRLGAQIGITAVLHTWSRDLGWHPHLHCVVTGGGLAPLADRWVPARTDYLFPVKVLSRLFRGKLLDALRKSYDRGRLDLGGSCTKLKDRTVFGRLIDRLYRKQWVVYSKRPFGGPDQVFEYLGRYTHRVAISNSRIVAIDEQGITFLTRDGKSTTVAPGEFIRRFLFHVLPKGFVKIRHFGLMAACHATTTLELARQLIELNQERIAPSRSIDHQLGWKDLLRLLTGLDVSVCPLCRIGLMRRLPLERLLPSGTQVEPQDTS